MRESTNTILEQDGLISDAEHAYLCALYREACRATGYFHERDDYLVKRGVSPELARNIRVLHDGAAHVSWRKQVEDVSRRLQQQRAEQAAARQDERNRAPDLFEQSAIDAVGTLTRFHIAYTTNTSDALAMVEIQGWKPSGRFAGKPQGEFVVLRLSHPTASAPDWQWPANVEHLTCTPLAARSLKVRDAFVRHALQATAFGAMSDGDRRHRSALCACADILDPALAHSAPRVSAS